MVRFGAKFAVGILIIVMMAGCGGGGDSSITSLITSSEESPNTGLASLMEGAVAPPSITGSTKPISDYVTADGELLGEVEVIEGEAIVVFSSTASQEEEEATLSNYGATILSKLPALHTYLVSYSGDTMTFLKAIRANGLVELAEAEMPVSSFYSRIVPPETLDYETWYLEAINGPEAWDITFGSSSVELCIIDTGFKGITSETADFEGRIVGELPQADGEGDPHGAIVAGIATAANNSTQMVGISWNNMIRLKRVLPSFGRVRYRLVEAIAGGASVINVSLGPRSLLGGVWRAWNAVVVDAVYKANLKFKEAGIKVRYAVVFASGDNGIEIPEPKVYPENVIYVGGTDGDNAKWGPSNYGAHLDISAPATSIGFYDYYTQQYGVTQGTSFSAPMVAGACALLWALKGDLTGAHIKTILKNTATPFSTQPDVNIGVGILNLYAALLNVLSAIVPEPPSALKATAVSSSQIQLSWTDNSNNEDGFKIERSQDGVSFIQIATVGANVTSFSDSGLLMSTTYYYRLRAYNSAGDSSYSNIASATTPAITWQIETVDSGQVEGQPAIMLYNDYPWIAYYSAGDLKCARWTGSSWEIQTVDSEGDVGKYASIALDGHRPQISYYDATNGDLKYARVACWSPLLWITETVDGAGDLNVGISTSIVIQALIPHISYYDATNGDLKLAYRDPTVGWVKGVIDSEGDVGKYTSLAAGKYNYISYLDSTNSSLKQAACVRTKPVEITVVDKSVSGPTSIDAVGSYRHIAYFGTGVDGVAIKHAKWDGVSWKIQIVDNISPDMGAYPAGISISIDSNGYPHLAYTLNSIIDYTVAKYAHWTGTGWQVNEIPVGGWGMGGISLALDSNDSPHIICTVNGQLTYIRPK